MKKEMFVTIMFCLLVLSAFSVAVLASAEQENKPGAGQIVKNYISNSTNKTLKDIRNEIKDDLKDLRETRKELKGDIKAYLKERKEIKSEIKGKNLTFDKGDRDEVKFRVKNSTARTTLNITEGVDDKNNTILLIQKGNNTKEIKIMPDTAAERALARLRIKVCNETNGCTIELKDVPAGKFKESKLAYEIQLQRHYKILGLFKAKAENKVQVDAQTGDVIQEKKPWWAFLASQSSD